VAAPFLLRARGGNDAHRARSIAQRRARNPYVIDVFGKSKKITRDLARLRDATRAARRARMSLRNIWCRRACEYASLCENTGFFVAL
jgi:hypothetical protein